ncbi:MAG TPA: hypothetical protein VNV37_09225 [Solirubrobacteraceae bacterium]|jgi:hypothetical protein|nr:hypothetical protein [Solirubrobacteraceae bacterium]
MSGILRSLKADLLDRRMLPILLVVGALLLGALAYTLLAGGSGASEGAASSAAAGPSVTPGAPGPNLAVTNAPANPHAAVAETTDGGAYQHKPGSHNPFAPLPAPKQKSMPVALSPSPTSSSSSSKSSTPSEESKSQSTMPSSGGSAPSKPSTPAPHKPQKTRKVVETVGVAFGPVVANEPPQLLPYPSVQVGQQLPSSQDSRLAFTGLYDDHKQAVFALSEEAILKGPAICLPSATQCEKLLMQAGQTEELGYFEADGQTVNYELQLQTIAWHEESVTATTSRRHHRHHHRPR